MFLNRILRALQLEDAVYEELASDPAPLAQSILLVALSSLSVGVGGSGGHSENILPGTITFLIAWTLSVIIIYIIGISSSLFYVIIFWIFSFFFFRLCFLLVFVFLH